MFENPTDQKPSNLLGLSAGMVPARSKRGGNQTRQAPYEKNRSSSQALRVGRLSPMRPTARNFRIDLSEERKLPNHQPPTIPSESNSQTASKLKVDFAVLDEEVKATIHAVL